MKTKNLTATISRWLIALPLAFIATSALAAPMPGTANSKLVAPQLGLYRSPLGFQISAGDSGWLHSEPPKDNKFIQTVYRAPSTGGQNGKQDAVAGASLTVRVDELKKNIALDKYIQRWVKEYPKYGFDVLGSKSFVQNKQRGYVVDLLNRDNKKQLRQVVFMSKQRAVILTCRDQSVSFKQALKGCNQIIRTFDWVE